MPNRERLSGVLDLINSSNSANVRLYFITKNLKSGVSRREKALNKYQYECIRVNVDESLQRYFLMLLHGQVQAVLANDEIEYTEFQIIDDDFRDKIYTYALNNATSFHDLLNNKMVAGVDIPYVSSLSQIRDNLCAYSISIEDGTSIRLISFRRITRARIATEQSAGLKALFRTNDRRLVSTDGESINFDEKVDCVFHDGDFFVFHKKSFENLAGLDDEYKAMALEMLEELAENDFVSGINLLLDEAGKSPIVAKQLARISKAQGHRNIDQNRISKMQEICSSLGLNLKVEDGKIVVDDLNDAKLLIRLLDQYYLSCMQTGDAFGSHAKKKLDAGNT